MDAKYMAVTDVLREIGVPAHMKGYDFVREAVLLVLEDVALIWKVVDQLYPSVAKKFDTTPSNVERSIRNCLGHMWENGDLEAIKKVCGASNKKITNGRFIAALADYVRVYRLVDIA